MKYKIAICQLKTGEGKRKNIDRAEVMLREAAENGAKVLVLPEMWNCPYSNACFPEYAEEEGGESYQFLRKMAKELAAYIVGGSTPEKVFQAEANTPTLYNTSYIFNPNGACIGKHRKAHLFDVSISGGINFKESDTLTAGEKSTVIETEFGQIGVAICYDIRFPELIRKMTLDGIKLLVLPAAFNMTTGPTHWELTMRARALDNQIYIAAASPARDEEGRYIAYGHSMIVSPWGEVLEDAGTEANVIYSMIDLDYEEKIRTELPLLKHRRPELY
ncbi:MAG: carbon-nitrogen hydrolase family protein [Anaerovoracaceae bacterium]